MPNSCHGGHNTYFTSKYYAPLVPFICISSLKSYILQVPGAEGNFVFIKDAHYKKPDPSLLPFPTYFPTEDEDPTALEPIVADLGDEDPFMVAD